MWRRGLNQRVMRGWGKEAPGGDRMAQSHRKTPCLGDRVGVEGSVLGCSDTRDASSQILC